jgi:hypothetical protein
LQFQQLTVAHRTSLPIISSEMVESYIHTVDGGCNSTKSIEKELKLVESMRGAACSFAKLEDSIYFTGFVKAAMKKKISYNFKLQLNILSGMPDQALN